MKKRKKKETQSHRDFSGAGFLGTVVGKLKTITKSISSRIGASVITGKNHSALLSDEEEISGEEINQENQLVESNEKLPHFEMLSDEESGDDAFLEEDRVFTIPSELAASHQPLWQVNFRIKEKDGKESLYTGMLNEQAQREGWGESVRKDGSCRYSGEWKNDEPCGEGIRDEPSKTSRGEFKGNVLVKGFVEERHERDGYEYRYEGKVQNGHYHGKGTFKIIFGNPLLKDNPEKYRLSGKWKQGKIIRVDLDESRVAFTQAYENFCNILWNLQREMDLDVLRQNLRELRRINIQIQGLPQAELQLLKEIEKSGVDLGGLKAVAGQLWNLKRAHAHVQSYFEEPPAMDLVGKHVLKFITGGLKDYLNRLSLKDTTRRLVTLDQILDFSSSASSSVGYGGAHEKADILDIHPRVVELIKDILNTLDGRVQDSFSPLELSTFVTDFRQKLSALWGRYLRFLEKDLKKNREEPHRYDDQLHDFLVASYAASVGLRIKKIEDENGVSNIQQECHEVLQGMFGSVLGSVTPWEGVEYSGLQRFMGNKKITSRDPIPSLFFSLILQAFNLCLEKVKNFSSEDSEISGSLEEVRLIIEKVFENRKKEKTVDYGKEYRGVSELIDYFISIGGKNNANKNNITIQLKAIVDLVNAKADLSKIVERFSEFNKNRFLLTEHFNQSGLRDVFGSEIQDIENRIDALFKNILESTSTVQDQQEALGMLDSLIVNLGSVDLSWYVKTEHVSSEHQRHRMFSSISEGKTLKINLEEFLKEPGLVEKPVHHALNVIDELLKRVETTRLAEKGSSADEGTTAINPEDNVLQVQAQLMRGLSCSLKHFSEQEKYVDYDRFKTDFVNIFDLSIKGSKNIIELANAVNQSEYRYATCLNTREIKYQDVFKWINADDKNKVTEIEQKNILEACDVYQETFDEYRDSVFNRKFPDFKARASEKYKNKEESILEAIKLQPINIEKIRVLIKLGANLDYKDAEGKYFLDHALASRNQDLIKLLLISGATKVSLPEEVSRSKKEDCDKKEKETSKANPSGTENNGGARASSPAMSDLIRAGGRFKIKISELGLEALEKYYSLKHKLNPSDYKKPEYLLRLAASKGKLNHVKLLFQIRPDLNVDGIGSDSKRTALHWAVLGAHESVVKFLLEQGARVDLRDNQSKTAQDYAQAKNIGDIFSKNPSPHFEKRCLLARYSQGGPSAGDALKEAILQNKVKDSQKIFHYPEVLDQDKKEAIDLSKKSPRRNNFLKAFSPQSLSMIDEVIEQTRALANLWAELKKNGPEKFDPKNLNPLLKDFYFITSPHSQNAFALKKQIIPRIIAGLAIILTVFNSAFARENIDPTTGKSTFEFKEGSSFNYLLKPHCVQVLGILRILGIDKPGQEIPNHLAEVLTGQGKSWVLGILAGFFSLQGSAVDVACYSEYLTKRDQVDFTRILGSAFKFNNVRYLTLDEMCKSFLEKKGGSLPELVESIVTGIRPAAVEGEESLVRDKILLLDEVDVFFADKFGETKSYSRMIHNETIAFLQRKIWEKVRANLSEEDIDNNVRKHILPDLIKKDPILSFLEKQEIQSLDVQGKPLPKKTILEIHVLQMIKDALKIKSLKEEKFKMSSSGRSVQVRRGDTYEDKFLGYQNSFFYIQRHWGSSEGSLPHPNPKAGDLTYGYLMFNAGKVSFSLLPDGYSQKFGVTGSLRHLAQGEQKMLKRYHLNQQSFFPTFYGKRKLNIVGFEKEEAGCKIQANKEAWFLSIVDRARKELLSKRPVLIFFETESLLEEFSEKYINLLKSSADYRSMTSNKVYDGSQFFEKDSLEYESKLAQLIDGSKDAKPTVTLSTREFGRGTDFKVSAAAVRSGGVHGIQTFLSIDPKEEVQIKGRVARKDEPGSHELVLCLEHLKSKFKEVTVDSDYKWLTKQRDHYYEVECQKREVRVKNAEDLHTKTINLYDESTKFFKQKNRQEMDYDKRGQLVQQVQKDFSAPSYSHSRTIVLMDATPSMDGFIRGAQSQVLEMFKRAKVVLAAHDIPTDSFEIQFVAYRNYPADKNGLLEVSQWQKDPEELKTFMENLGTHSGGGNEAIEIGFWHVNKEIESGVNVSQVILIGDYPPNTVEEVSKKRAKRTEAYWSTTRFATPTHYLPELEKIISAGIPVHSFYVNTPAKDKFIEIARATAGQSGFLDVRSIADAEVLTNVVTALILQSVGGDELVEAYRSEYGQQGPKV